jgi:hypothetical protein
VKPAAVLAFGVFFALVGALLVAARRLASHAKREHADEVLRAEIDRLDRCQRTDKRTRP